MSPLDYFFLPLLACAALFYVLGTALLARHHARRRADPDLETPVTVLKPLAGNRPGLEAALESFLRQTHPRAQVLFGVGASEDSARPVAEALLQRHPDVDAEVVVAGAPIGPNRKVTSLHAMAARAKHDLLVISDDDAVAGPDLVARLAGEMRDPAVGLATATYRARPKSLPLALHALTMATEFFPSVVTAEAIEGGLSFALGAASIARRRLLADIGGFAALSEFLAEDYQMGALGRKAGWTIRLSREAVEVAEEFRSVRGFLVHQLRWARTYRACRPGGYFASVLTQGTAIAAAYVAAAGASATALWAAGALVALRLATGAVHVALRGPASLWAWLWLLPARDLLATALWAASFGGNRVRWRESEFRVTAGGRLEPV